MTAFGPGDRVNHSVYGDGTVTNIDQYHTRVTFDAHGLKTFVSSKIVLTSSSTPAPERPKPHRRKRVAVDGQRSPAAGAA